MKKNYNQPQTELIEFAPETAICQIAMVSGEVGGAGEPPVYTD